ncbi:MAG TPA: FG-GAP-like repeat-containing protein [Noviherbaspirillum sp.]|uniref:FG-GAP-like repeat-containing protein n=1 Tax=Noviherbaspirillum sp. TaxID=1926288 RepID=UPI002D36346B|nr:FG-GAP-like repeat-containing protein [Noviherbaspirillum sp.]HYD93873.1 FG-GAP-like repeat-containing protein [Noviherbaspirillum sp.]
MDYNGSAQDDVIDQVKAGLPDWTTIHGGAGNDTITLKIGHAVGGAGNDTFYGTDRWSNVAYWDAARGVKVDLANGWADDGLGGVDTLVNISSVHGSPFDDVFTGSARNEFFSGARGNDTFIGGGGTDEVSYYFARSTDAAISYDAASDSFTVVKNFPNGERGTDTLKGISAITFTGEGSDHAYLSRDSFVPVNGFLRVPGATTIALPSGSGITQVKAGDFNGDGSADLYLCTQVGTGTAPSPIYFFTGDGQGRFSDATTGVFPNAPKLVVGGGRTIAADFNRDGMTDVFQLDFGNDAPPFPGGQNRLFLSSSTTRQFADASATLIQQTATNHAGSTGDVNADGYPDLLVNTLSLGNVLYINDKTGHFAHRPDLLPGGAQTNAASGMIDVNGDRHADLIVGKWDSAGSTPATQLLLNDGAGSFAKAVPINLPASGVAQEIVLDVKAIDLNGDAKPDLMLSVTNGGGSSVDYGNSSYYTTAYIQLLVNEGNGSFRDETAARLPAAVQAEFGKGWFDSLTSVDFNHDGHADILASVGGFTSSFVLLNRGDGSFSKGWSSAFDGRSVAADIDGDGAEDIVTVASQSIHAFVNRFDNQRIYKAGFGGASLSGSAGDDFFHGSDGNDSFDGKAGVDTVNLAGRRADYRITRTGTGVALEDKAKAGGNDLLKNVERLAFADFNVDLSIGDAAQTVNSADLKLLQELYIAFFNRVPDAEGLAYWIGRFNAGQTLSGIADSFYAAAVQYPELTGYTAAMSNDDFVRRIYKNVLGRSGDTAPADSDVGYWSGELAAGRSSKGNLVAAMLSSAHSFKGHQQWGWVADLLDNKLAVADYFAVQQGLGYKTAEESIARGMAIAAAVTPADTAAAIALIGISDAGPPG